jgi:hypothetical protein
LKGAPLGSLDMAQTLTRRAPPKRHAPPAPPRWKSTVVVWLAIYPSLTLLLWLAGPAIVDWPLALRTLVLTALLVPWMVFVMLPARQRFWLRGCATREIDCAIESWKGRLTSWQAHRKSVSISQRCLLGCSR